MGIRNAKREALRRLDCKTLDAQFKSTIGEGLNCCCRLDTAVRAGFRIGGHGPPYGSIRASAFDCVLQDRARGVFDL